MHVSSTVLDVCQIECLISTFQGSDSVLLSTLHFLTILIITLPLFIQESRHLSFCMQCLPDWVLDFLLERKFQNPVRVLNSIEFFSVVIVIGPAGLRTVLRLRLPYATIGYGQYREPSSQILTAESEASGPFTVNVNQRLKSKSRC